MKGNMMKKLKCKLMMVLAFMLATLPPLAPLAPVAAVGVISVGCASTNGGDSVLINAEKTAEMSLSVMDGFVTIEQDNRAFLNTVSPKIEEASHKIQNEGMKAWDGLRQATATYKANRTEENKANVNTWIATLKTFRELAEKYTTEATAAMVKKREAAKTAGK